MHVIVTGVAGFIAARVAALLLDEGHQVTGIDDINDAYDVRLKTWRLDRVEGRPGFRFHKADIADRDAMRSLFASLGAPGETRPDAVINLAARAGVRYSVIDPWVYHRTNVTGTLNLLEECRTHGIGKFVLASTSSLYGQDNPMPYREDANTDRPLSPYAASKKAAEVLCYTYHHLHGLDVSVPRFFTVYGPAGRPDMMPLRFTQWLFEGRPLTVFGDGTQERDFTYVDDVARGTVAALKPLGYEVINLGSDKPVRLTEIIRLLEELVGQKARIEHRPRHPADVQATWANIDKAESLLAWRPRVGFVEGFGNLVDWYRHNREWAKAINTD